MRRGNPGNRVEREDMLSKLPQGQIPRTIGTFSKQVNMLNEKIRGQIQ